MSEDAYRCECGKVHKHPLYVFAHWDERLIHACECGVKNELYRGKVISPIRPLRIERVEVENERG